MFDWPRFRRDTAGVFKHLKVLGEDPRAEGKENGSNSTKDRYAKEREKISEAIDDAYTTCEAEEICPTAENVHERMQWDAFGLGSKKETKLKTFLTWFKYEEVKKLFKLGGTGKSALKWKGASVDHLIVRVED